MDNIIESFFIAVLFDDKKTDESAKKTQNVISNFAKRALTSLAALTSIDVLKGITDNFQQHANKLGDIAEKVGDNVENVDAYRKAVEMVNGDAEEFTGTLTKIGQNIQKINTVEGKQFSQTLKQFGISAKDSDGYLKNATDIISDYAEKYNKLNSIQKKENFAKTLGIDESTIKLLKQGKEGVNKLVKEMYYLGVVSKEQVKLAREFRTAQKQLDYAMQFVANKLSAFLIPVFTKFAQITKDFIVYLQEHKDLVIGFFAGLSAVIMTKLIPAFARLAIATATNPFTWLILGITALIALFAILYEDFKKYQNGERSYFADVYDVILNTVKAVENFIEENQELIDTIKEIGAIAFEVFKIIAKVLFITGKAYVEFFINRLKDSFAIIKAVGGFINDYILQPILKVLEKFNVLSKIKNMFKSGNEQLNDYIKNDGKGVISQKTINSINQMISAKQNKPEMQSQLKNGASIKTTTVKDSNNQTNTINVYAKSDDPKSLANEIKNVIPKNKALNTLAFDNGSLS